MSGIRLVATDVDGTLCDKDDRITPAVRQAVADCLAQGVKVLVATGRTPVTARLTVEELGCDVPLVLANGALVSESIDEAPWHCRLLPADVAREVVRAHRAHGAEPLVYEDPRVSDLVYWEREHPTTAAFIVRNIERAERVPDLVEWIQRDVLLTATFGDQATMRGLSAAIGETLGEQVRVQPLWHPLYDSWSLDVMAPGCTKWDAIARYADRHGIPREAVMAIGDSLNDLPMITGAGLGVAMGNALDEVKAAAGAVVADNEHDGWVEAVQRFVLS